MSEKNILLTSKTWTLTAIGGLCIVFLLLAGNIIEMVESTDVVVIQYPSGTLKVVTEPGPAMQLFGSVTKYPLRSQFSFSAANDQGNAKNESIQIRFNDGGTARVSGVVSWEMPSDTDSVIKLHRKFGSTSAIEQQLIRTAIESATFTTGPLMSSMESAAEKRNDLLQYLQDQAKNGAYRTKVVSVKVTDPLTNQEKTVNAAEIVVDDKGIPVRDSGTMMTEFGVHLMPMTVNSIHYDDIIEQQIKKRQESIQAVQQAQANALKAQQDAITAEKNGEAKAAEAKWAQETIKAQQVTEAQQKLEVATLSAKEAEQYKREQILRGEGDAEKQKLIMAANGALDQKLQAWVEVQSAWANAVANYKGNWVPTTVMGNANTSSGSGALQMLDLLAAKTAKDLSLDMSIESNKK